MSTAYRPTVERSAGSNNLNMEIHRAPEVPERPDHNYREYIDTDITHSLISLHWATMSKLYVKHIRYFREQAAEHTVHGDMLKSKLAYLN